MKTEIDIEDMPPKMLRKMLRTMMAGCKCGENVEEAIEQADKDREELSNLQAENNGKPPEVPVTKDDLPSKPDEEEDDKKKKAD